MTIYYVDVNGSDNATGTASSPFRTIQHALDSGLGAGDEVVVRAGTYSESLNISDGGSAAGNVILRAEEPGTVLLNPPSGSWNGISVNSNYVTIQGFEIAGANGDGIEASNVHHIEVLDNVIHDSGESGIQFNWSEFILIEGNTTYSNAKDGWFSGISVYENRNISGDTTTEGYRTIIRDNTSYDNVTQSGQHTDGNGIIIDDFQSTQTSGYPSYTYPTLVENNLVYENGGKGIQVTWSDYVTVRGNTAWHNNQDLLNTGTWRGEISNSQSSNNTFVNNIAVADPTINSSNTAIDNTSYGGYSNDNVIWANNLTFDGTAGYASVRTDGGNAMPSAADGNLLGVDPGFIGAPGDFHLAIGSAAIDAGTSDYGVASTDLDGGARVVGIIDIGAFESGSGSTTDPTPTNTAPTATDDGGFTATSGSTTLIDFASLLANDSDPDGDALTITGVSGAQNGTASVVNGTQVSFTPDAGFTGTALFNYSISDGQGGTDTAQVAVTVEAAPDGGTNTAPNAVDDGGFTATQDTALSIDTAALLANDTDTDGDPLTVTAVSGAQNGTVELVNGNQISFTPNAGFTGTATFGYSIADGQGGTDTAQVAVTVEAAPTSTPTDTSGSFGLWDDTVTPDVTQDQDTGAVTLGLRFTADVDATLDALQIYVSEANAGAQSIALWSGDGTLLAEADGTVAGSGWQTVPFDAPADLVAGEDYVVSYYAPNGAYAVSSNYFDAAEDAGPISLQPNAGVYSYGYGGSTFPNESYYSSNYWVDVVLEPDVAGTTTSDPTPETTPTTTPATDSVIGEAGIVVVDQAHAGTWQTVTFETPLDDPSIVMGGGTNDSSQPYTIQVRNVTSTGFEYQIDKWDYLDDSAVTETVSWLAVEAGTHDLADGRTISAGHGTVGGTTTGLSFEAGAFDAAPVVLGQSIGEGNDMAVTDRIDGVTATGFQAQLFQQEAKVGAIAADGFDWIAVEQGGSAADGALAGNTGRVVDDNGSVVDLGGSFAGDYAFVADMQTLYGKDTSTVELMASDADSVTLGILEEQSRNDEMRHTDEDVGYAGFEVGVIEGTDHFDISPM